VFRKRFSSVSRIKHFFVAAILRQGYILVPNMRPNRSQSRIRSVTNPILQQPDIPQKPSAQIGTVTRLGFVPLTPAPRSKGSVRYAPTLRAVVVSRCPNHAPALKGYHHRVREASQWFRN
jgi:hypothetical protein